MPTRRPLGEKCGALQAGARVAYRGPLKKGCVSRRQGFESPPALGMPGNRST